MEVGSGCSHLITSSNYRLLNQLQWITLDSQSGIYLYTKCPKAYVLYNSLYLLDYNNMPLYSVSIWTTASCAMNYWNV